MKASPNEQLVYDLEKKIDRLQVAYTQYFMGFEKLEPMHERQVVERLFTQIRRLTINNTALRFRFQSQVQKYNTLKQYWNRICRQIEEGTYKRDVRRAQQRSGGQPPQPARRSTAPPPPVALDRPSASSVGVFGELDDPFADNVPNAGHGAAEAVLDDELQSFFGRPSAPPSTPKGAPPVPDQNPPSQLDRMKRQREQARAAAERAQTASKRDLSEERMKRIYAAYVTARKRCNEPVESVPYERVARSLMKQYKKSGGNVDFKVVVRGGKAAIKAVKKKQETEPA